MFSAFKRIEPAVRGYKNEKEFLCIVLLLL